MVIPPPLPTWAVITRVIGCVLLILAIPITTIGDEPKRPQSKTKETADSEWQTPIRFFQRTISRADGSRCAMHPTCSHYASSAFKTHNFFTAWMLTSDRLLRCGRDETRKAPRVIVHGELKAYDPISANIFWWSKPGGKP